MTNISKTAATLALGAALAGCGGERYEDQRPPVDALVDGNTGIQAKDVGAATDRMATDLLALPELNASQHQWTVVLTDVVNNGGDPTMGYDAFTQRLRSRLGQLGHGRVALIENKAKFHNLQNQELEQPGDAYGQGGGAGANPAGVQPDFGLYITIDRMPNRATEYFNITATLTNLHTRVQVWVSPAYEFQSAR